MTPPSVVDVEISVQEKALDRLKKVLALAARRDRNENEAQAASLRMFRMLEAQPLPIRYLVASGAEVRLLPTPYLRHASRKSLVQKIRARRRNLFLEQHRMKDADGLQALERGYLAFDRHGYVIFVKLGDVQVFF